MNRIKKVLVSGTATVLLAGAAMLGLTTAAKASLPFTCDALEAQAANFYNQPVLAFSRGLLQQCR